MTKKVKIGDEFLHLHFFYESDPDYNSRLSFHYKRLIAVQESIQLLEKDGKEISSPSDIYVTGFPERIQVKETELEIFEQWCKCRINSIDNEKMMMKEENKNDEQKMCPLTKIQ